MRRPYRSSGPTKRKPVSYLRPSVLPHACITLNVDTAERSGWCIAQAGKPVTSGEVDIRREPTAVRAIVQTALDCGLAAGMPVVLVYERPYGGTTQGQYIGAWKAAWFELGAVKSRTVGVYTSMYRSRVLGSRWARADRDTARKCEQQYAATIVGRACGPDESAAVCISVWSARAPEVLVKLPKSMQPAPGGVV